MMRKNIKINTVLFLVLLIIPFGTLLGSDIFKILEGYGRDSIATFSTRDAQAEAATLFNLILEPSGEVTVEKAEQYLNSAQSKIVKSYLAVMLADYAFVNKNNDSGMRYLKKAVEEHDPIRNDSYYRLVLSRAQNNIKESPGQEQEHKTSVLQTFNPPAIKENRTVKMLTQDAAPTKTESTEIKVPATETPQQEAVKKINFMIQVGAFSVQDNAFRKRDYFMERNYPVDVLKRQRSDGYLYLVRIGEYTTYDEAKQALSELKNKYPSEDGIVIKVSK